MYTKAKIFCKSLFQKEVPNETKDHSGDTYGSIQNQMHQRLKTKEKEQKEKIISKTKFSFHERNPKFKKVLETLRIRENTHIFRTLEFFLFKRNKNYHRTTKYTFLNFIFMSIFTQLKKVSNLYFITIMIINVIASTTTPIYSIFPVCFIIGVGIVKDLFEEFKRLVIDIKENFKKVSIVDPFLVSKVIKKDPNDAQPLLVSFDDLINHSYSSCHISKGDIVIVYNNSVIPADLIFLKSSESDGFAYCETANLDGETNLKRKESVFMSPLLSNSDLLTSEQQFEVPTNNSTNLHTFKGKITYHSKLKSKNPKKEKFLGIDNLLLKGTTLKNTNYVIGIVVYSGKDTKMFKNTKKKTTKWGKLDTVLNYFVFIVLFIQQLILLFLVIGQFFYNLYKTHTFWFLGNGGEGNGGIIDHSSNNIWTIISGYMNEYMNFIVLFQMLVPASLFVTMEVVLASQAKSMELNIKDEETGKSMIAKTSNLNWNLAFVDVIFSDKTGTLTKNQMKYKGCFLDGHFFDSRKIQDQISSEKNSNERKNKEKLVDLFLSSVVVNNSVTPNHFHHIQKRKKRRKSQIKLQKQKFQVPTIAQNQKIQYENHEIDEESFSGISTDEVELVKKLAFGNQYVLVSRNSKKVEFLVYDSKQEKMVKREYKILRIIPFTSKRKRMSVFVSIKQSSLQDKSTNNTKKGKKYEEKILCFTKGADNIIFPRVSKEEEEKIKQIEDASNKYSEKGFRTLIYAYKEIPKSQYLKWEKRMKQEERKCQDTNINVHDDTDTENNGDAGMEKVENVMENDLHLLGVTAIEDTLQDEVPETIGKLRKADIKIFVLTGDKIETTISTCYSANIINKGKDWEIRMTYKDYFGSLIHLKELISNVCEYIQKNQKKIKDKRFKFVLILDSQSIDHILTHFKTEFLYVIQNCSSIICSRFTPLQKSIVVSLVKTKLKKQVCAVGDGANDVSMIQKANVGIGIMGKEGTQAARSSDYAIPKFKFLCDLLLVEGRYSYLRAADCIYTSFYKNIALTFGNICFAFFSLFSGQWFINAWTYQVYNTFFHAIVPTYFGLFEKDIDRETLLHNPKYYANMKKKKPYYNIFRTFYWTAKGIIDAFFAFFFTLLFTFEGNLYGKSFGLNTIMKDSDEIYCFGSIIITSFTITVFLNQYLMAKIPTHLLIYGLIFSFVSYYAFIIFLSFFTDAFGVKTFYFIAIFSLDKLKYYLVILFIVTVNIFPSLFFKVIGLLTTPMDWQKAAYKRNREKRKNLSQCQP